MFYEERRYKKTRKVIKIGPSDIDNFQDKEYNYDKEFIIELLNDVNELNQLKLTNRAEQLTIDTTQRPIILLRPFIQPPQYYNIIHNIHVSYFKVERGNYFLIFSS